MQGSARTALGRPLGLQCVSRRPPLGGRCAWTPNPCFRSPAASPASCPRPAALPIPRNQVGKTRAARLPGPGGTKDRTREPAASARLLERLAPGRSGHRVGRAAGHPAPGRRRGRSRFLSAQRTRSLLCYSPRLRTGRGTGSPLATGKERASGRARLRRGPQPGIRRPPPRQQTLASGEAQTGADRPPNSLRSDWKLG